MDRLRPDILEILEYIGENGELPHYFSDSEKEDFIKNLPRIYINQKLGEPELRDFVHRAYRNFDNEALMKVVYILMGYHYLETMCSRHGYGGSFGSPTFLGGNIDYYNLDLDDEIDRFIRLFVATYGGNYYSRSVPHINSVDFIKISNYLKYLQNRDLKEYFKHLKLQKEKNLDIQIMKEMKNKISQRKQEEEYEKRKVFIMSKTWYPYATEIEELENDIRILKNQVVQSEKRLKYYQYLFAQAKIIPEFSEKSSAEILSYLISSPDPIDFYESLFTQIKMEDIKNLNQDDYKLLLNKFKTTRKNSKFRKLYKKLLGE